MSSTGQPLTWALVIATYQRPQLLLRCLRLAVQQTRTPGELVIIDASSDWRAIRDQAMAVAAQSHARCMYEAATKRSSSAQRNQGIRRASADILFLIDDDSLMYPDCAQQIMRVYEADNQGLVAGVNAVHVSRAPDQPDDAPQTLSEHGTTKRYGLLASAVRRILRAEDLFVPYDAAFPEHRLPDSLQGLPVAVRPLMAGWGMTFRRSVCLSEPFAEILMHYAAGEDSDMGYRASRHGLLLTAFNARLCHLGADGGRLSPFVVAALGNLNPLVLHRLYSSDLSRSRRRSRRLLWRRTLILLAKDLSQGRLTCPAARGAWLALRWLRSVFSMSESELRLWYEAFQDRLIASHTPAGG